MPLPRQRHSSRRRPPARPERGGVLIKMLLCLVCVLAMIALAWMLFLPALTASALEKRTGFVVRIASLYANPFSGRIDLQGVQVENPDDVGQGELLDLRRLTATVELASLLPGRRVEVDALEVDVARLRIATNERGGNNLDVFARRLGWLPEAKAGDKEKPPRRDATPADDDSADDSRKFSIHRLDVSLDEILVVDAGANPPVRRVERLGFRHGYRAIMNGGQFLIETLAALKQRDAGATFSALLPCDAGRELDAFVGVSAPALAPAAW